MPTLQGLDGGQSCHPGSPQPGLAGVRGLGPAATALITWSVQRPRRPPLSYSPPPASTVLLAGRLPLKRQQPPHSSPEGSGRPHLSGQHSLPTHSLSCPYTHRPGGRRGGCLAPQLGSQHPDQNKRSGSRWAAQGPSLWPQLRSGLAPRTGHRAQGGWGHRQGLPGLGSHGRSPCEARVWELLLTPAGSQGSMGLQEDSSKVWEQVRWRGRQSCARGPVVVSGLRAEAVPRPRGPLPSCEGQFNPMGLCPPGLPALSLGGRHRACGMGGAGDQGGGQPESAAPP